MAKLRLGALLSGPFGEKSSVKAMKPSGFWVFSA
jgi:hypothetical protein